MNFLKKLSKFLNHSEVEWKGHQTCNGRKNTLKIKHMIVDSQGCLSGGGKDPKGRFKVTGWMDKSGHLNFTKNYDSGQVGATFKGKFRKGVMTGFWQDEESSGNFELTLRKANLFKGCYSREDTKEPRYCYMWLKVNRGGVWGLGEDELGSFVLHGTRTKAKEYEFRLSYLGMITICHKAELMKMREGRGHKLKGTWKNDKKRAKGKFVILQALAGTEEPQKEETTATKSPSLGSNVIRVRQTEELKNQRKISQDITTFFTRSPPKNKRRKRGAKGFRFGYNDTTGTSGGLSFGQQRENRDGSSDSAGDHSAVREAAYGACDGYEAVGSDHQSHQF